VSKKDPLHQKKSLLFSLAKKESLFNFAANKKTANAGNIRSLIFFEKRKV
jgi:hypothetical protein